jgi:serine phosphatase RsbU (regulator of sigma subunit)/anti-sigma regulatory factor (Ser/Thr protein kinase)
MGAPARASHDVATPEPPSRPELALVPPAAAPARATAPPTLATGAPPRRAIVSIRWIVTFTSVALIAAAVVAMAVVSERNSRAALTREVENRLLLQAHNLALAGGDAMLSDFPELTLHPLALEIAAKQPELALVEVVDPDGKIVGDPDARKIGAAFALTDAFRPRLGRALAAGDRLLSDGRTLVATVPVVHRDGRRLGTAYVGLKLSYLDGVVLAARRQATIVLLIVLALGVLAALWMISVVLRPISALRAGIERIGRGDLTTPVTLRDRTELGMLADAMNGMTGALRRAQAELVERERLSRELELARQIQESLLPKQPHVAGAFRVQGSHRAALEVGGDYYDYFALPDGRIGLAIADVSGKGLAGCMVMSMLSALLRAYRRATSSPAELLAALDEQLGGTLRTGSFVTMFYGILDPRTGELVYASAGHNPLLVYRRDGGRLESFPTRGIPLGAMRGGVIRRTLQDRTLRLAPGDLLVQYTDGINEAFDPEGKEQFGVERLEQAITSTATAGADAVLASVRGAVEAWTGDSPPQDDETLIVVACEAAVRGASVPDAAPATLDPVALVATARATGQRLQVVADPASLAAIGPWIERGPLGSGRDRNSIEVMIVALHELCDNALEHGHGNAPTARIELWCVPPSPVATDARLRGGWFLMRDHGKPFMAAGWRATDFNDPNARTRGRGFGLDIIHRGASMVSYHPGTSEGNVTVLTFGERALNPNEEARP